MGESTIEKDNKTGEKAFVDRDTELEMISNTLFNLINNNGKMFLIEGDPGVGKSRILERIKEFAECEEINWYESTCVSKESAYYEPIIKTFQEKEPQHMKSTPSMMLRHSGNSNFAHPLFSKNHNLLREVNYIIRNFFVQGPCVYALEDLHFADRGTLFFLNCFQRG